MTESGYAAGRLGRGQIASTNDTMVRDIMNLSINSWYQLQATRTADAVMMLLHADEDTALTSQPAGYGCSSEGNEAPAACISCPRGNSGWLGLWSRIPCSSSASCDTPCWLNVSVV